MNLKLWPLTRHPNFHQDGDCLEALLILARAMSAEDRQALLCVAQKLSQSPSLLGKLYS